MNKELWTEADNSYQNGDTDNAINIYKKLYKDNHCLAATMIGAIYEVQKDEGSAIKWYEKELEICENIDTALRLAAIFIYSEKESTKDYQKALQIYSLDFLSNNHVALLNLGRIYFNGWGVQKDLNKAINFYSSSWCNGNLYAGHCLAGAYRQKRKWLKSIYFSIITRFKAIYKIIKGDFSEYARSY